MLNSYSENFLFEAYVFSAVLNNALVDKKQIFNVLGKCFMLKNEEIEEVYALSQTEDAEYIKSEADFLKYNRIKHYLEINKDGYSEVKIKEPLVANVKGKAYVEARKSNLLGVGERSTGAIIASLVEGANVGTVMALKVLGILECEGIIVEKDLSAGIKKLRKASEWNDLPATLYQLYYNESRRGHILTRLREMSKYGIYNGIYEKAKQHYNVADGRIIHEVSLLEQIFNGGVARREHCDPKYSRIISSKVLPFRDKEKIVFSSNSRLLAEAQCLPLKLKDRGSYINCEFLKQLPVYRENEVKNISNAIENSDLRTNDSYQPLCICCDEKYLLESTVDCFEDMSHEVNVVKIEAEHLTAMDMDPTGNNIFIRSCDEDRDNVFLITLVGNISDEVVKGVACFLQSEKREKFHLKEMGVEIDLSLILPIVFCDKENLKHLKKYCEVVSVASVEEKEKYQLISKMMQEKAIDYNVERVLIDDEAIEKLVKYSLDTINSAIDKAVKNNRVKRGEVHLCVEHFKDIERMSKENKTTFGFGG